MSNITVVRVLDWPIGVHGFPDDQRRILDVELAKRLGFGRPRDIRKLIGRLADSGEIAGVYVRDTVARTRMPTGGTREAAVTEFWLTMEEALYVTAKSETPTANEILKAVIKVFLAAREAHESDSKNRIGYITKLLLADTTCEWDLMWPVEFVEQMCKLNGQPFDGGQPRFLGSTYERIYKALLGADIYQELKSRNPEPQHGSNHHQWMTPVVRERLRREIPKITMLAKQCAETEEFWARFDHEYAGKMLQLSWLVPSRGAA